MEAVLAHPQNEAQANAIKAVLAALNIPYEEVGESSYDPAFVAKIKRSEKNFSEGKFQVIKTEDLWK